MSDSEGYELEIYEPRARAPPKIEHFIGALRNSRRRTFQTSVPIKIKDELLDLFKRHPFVTVVVPEGLDHIKSVLSDWRVGSIFIFTKSIGRDAAEYLRTRGTYSTPKVVYHCGDDIDKYARVIAAKHVFLIGR
jgi:hypothetical protein